MAATSPTLHKFIVWAPDKTEEGTLQRRLSVRPKHVEDGRDKIESGFISNLIHMNEAGSLLIMHLEVGGMVTTPESIESPGAEKKMIGSAFICEAENISIVREMVEKDVYYTSGVVSELVASWVKY
jgi:hypothetical protein